MALIKCKMCGGDMEIAADKTFGTCEFCGSTMTLPKLDDDQRAARFNRGNHFRRIGEFDKALSVYEQIVQEDDTDAEAHWCCALSRFGIEYVEDPATLEYIPTCHRASFDSILKDVDYQAAVENSTGLTRRQYQKDAAKIAEVQKGILATSQNEEPFDVFICYKESDDSGQRTRDSLLAQDIYYQLTDAGWRVFFSRITLEDKAGSEYEPYIFAALNSAKVMVVVGTKPEHFSAVWVKNEWSRFLALMRKDRSRLLLPCYRDMNPYDLPEQLSVLQSYDMSKIGFIQDLIRGVNKVLDAEKKPEPNRETVIAPSSALLKRGYMALEDSAFDEAKGLFNAVLNSQPECADAYLGMFMADILAKNIQQAGTKFVSKDLATNRYWQRARQFADGSLKTELENWEKMRIAMIAREAEKAQLDKIRYENERQERIASLSSIRQRYKQCNSILCAGPYGNVGLKSDGTVIVTRSYAYCFDEVSDWTDIIAVCAGEDHVVGLKSDGTVIAAGENNYGECNVGSWTDIVAVSTKYNHTVGLRADGTVVATGYNENGECNVTEWSEIIAIGAGNLHTVGLKSDGTVIMVGADPVVRLNRAVSGWRGIVAISVGSSYTVGLKADGTVLVAGGTSEMGDVRYWTDIVAICAGEDTTFGLKEDGTVIAEGSKQFGECNVSGWRNIVAISAGNTHSVGLKNDGSIVAVGDNGIGQCNIHDWKLCDEPLNFQNESKIARKQKLAEKQSRLKKEYQQLMLEQNELNSQERIGKVKLDKLKQELAELRGLFTGKRRIQLENEISAVEHLLSEIEAEIEDKKTLSESNKVQLAQIESQMKVIDI